MAAVGLARQAERGLLGLFILVLVWAPLPLASNRDWGVALLAMALWTCVALALWVRVLPSARSAWPTGGAAMAMLLLGYCAWSALPLGGWTPTAERYATQQYVLRGLTYTAGFLLVLLLASSPRRRMALMGGLLAAGVVQALLSVLLFARPEGYTVFYEPAGGTRAVGTFINPDHLAQYMLLTLSAGLGVMLAQMGSSRHRTLTGRERVLALAQFVMSPKMLVRLLMVLMVVVLVLTRSRAANGAFFMALPLLGLWVMVTTPSLRRSAALLVVSLLVVDLVVVGQWVGLDKVVQRLQDTELSQAQSTTPPAWADGDALRQQFREETLEERLRPARDALELIRQRPWTGWGGGSFVTVFPSVKREAIPLGYDHAHNDYVEIAADTGLVGLALLGLVVACTGVRLTRLLRERTPPLDRGLAAGVAVALFCALVHATVDFNLQIAANALTLTVLLAVAWCIPLTRSPSA
jgi:O-antigen ligase